MINDLNEINVSKKCLETLKKTFDYDTLVSLALNKDIINKNIKLLDSYGIENVDELFFNKYYIFILKTEELTKKFSKFNIPVFVQIINNDINAIDKIL